MFEQQEQIKELLKLYRKKIWPIIPGPFRSLVGEELKALEELIMEARAPRIAVVGRRGAGKSSLINAVFGAPVAAVGAVKSTTGRGVWHEYIGQEGRLEILDTRGLGDGSQPKESSAFATAPGEITANLSGKCPDALLFLCKAKEVDARIDEDMQNLADILKLIQKLHGYPVPVIGVVTQVDELDPVDVMPPYGDAVKTNNIAQACEALRLKLAVLAGETVEVIPTSAYLRFEGENIAADRRWNVDTLVEHLTGKLPRSAQLELARVSRVKTVQKRLAKTIIGSAVALSGAAGAQPIPIADMPVITGIQVGMIISIGYLSGRRLDKKSVKEFMGALGLNVSAALALRELARALVRLIPVGGNFISGSVAAGATWAIGQAAVAYFIEGRSIKESRKLFKEMRKKTKKGLPEKFTAS